MTLIEPASVAYGSPSAGPLTFAQPATTNNNAADSFIEVDIRGSLVGVSLGMTPFSEKAAN